MATVVLTSIGLSASQVWTFVENYTQARHHQSAVIITTAHADKAQNTYAILAQKQLQKLGITTITFLDLENESAESILQADICYVCGGNTFRLWQAIKTQHSENIFKQFLGMHDKLYIGVSAGALIVTPTIRMSTISDHEDTYRITDYTSLKAVHFEIWPHYTAAAEATVAAYERTYNTQVKRMSNEDFYAKDVTAGFEARGDQIEGIIFRKQKGKIEYLLLKRALERGGFWQPITGGCKVDELAQVALLREIAEEVQMTPVLQVLDEHYSFQFPLPDGTPKNEQVFAVEVPATCEPTLSLEHTEYRWLPYEEALALLKWENNKKALQFYHKHLTSALSTTDQA